jgi:hypothetical protein
MYKRREFTEDEKKLSEKIRNLLVLAENAMSCIPFCREKSIALTHIEDAMLHANLAITENSMIDV